MRSTSLVALSAIVSNGLVTGCLWPSERSANSWETAKRDQVFYPEGKYKKAKFRHALLHPIDPHSSLKLIPKTKAIYECHIEYANQLADMILIHRACKALGLPLPLALRVPDQGVGESSIISRPHRHTSTHRQTSKV